ncbi:hypothetical protein AB0G00_32750 [Nocardia salmonicida]|uniref:hypothetical protein n=1 Tax=Nocardia TaxID=1817 RepID=UPI002658B5C3|nr:hypothetical protein [Nocardia sp. PE-7]WKG11726.1 hypothetical protein QX204_09820 [Nocardia sp. PE-7]
MNHNRDHRPVRITGSGNDSEAPSMRWPDPSPMQPWWDQVMGGGSPLGKPRTRRSGGQQAPHLRKA